MTKLQKAALAKLIENTKGVSITGATYEDDGSGKLTRTENRPHAEIDRLFASADFKAGWNECRAKFVDTLQFIQTGKPSELRKYTR